jgi:hypothetical protein
MMRWRFLFMTTSSTPQYRRMPSTFTKPHRMVAEMKRGVHPSGMEIADQLHHELRRENET